MENNPKNKSSKLESLKEVYCLQHYSISTHQIYLHVQLGSYDINTHSLHQNIQTIQQNIQPYLNELYSWTIDNSLTLNGDKSTSTPFTPDPTEYYTSLNLRINGEAIPSVKHFKIPGFTFDPKLSCSEHAKTTKDKSPKPINILKALYFTSGGK